MTDIKFQQMRRALATKPDVCAICGKFRLTKIIVVTDEGQKRACDRCTKAAFEALNQTQRIEGD
jgi:hypothetical protein